MDIPNWIGPLIGSLGVTLAIIFFVLNYRARIGPRLAHQGYSLPVIGGAAPAFAGDLQILFRGRNVPRVTKSVIVLWNSGSATIRGTDIVPSDPIILRYPEGTEVLSARIVGVTRDVNAVSVTTMPNGNEVRCEFDYLDPKDGAVFEVVHTGERGNPKVGGTVRGMPRRAVNKGEIFEGIVIGRSRQVFLAILGVWFFFGILFTVREVMSVPALEPIFSFFDRWQPSYEIKFPKIVKYSGAGLLFPACIFFLTRRGFPKTLANAVKAVK
jgi:hypothetical protein